MQKRSYSITIAGKTITADFTDLTAHTNGSVLLTMGETVVLVTAVMSERANPNTHYFPLSVEFEERFYAAGAILGSRFMRREGRPSDEAILSARIVDRTIRPLFNQHLRHDVQVVVTVLAMGEDDPDMLGVLGASLALATSNIPWRGPVGVARIARNKETGQVVINPTYRERAEGKLDFEVLACGRDGLINMIETAAREVSEDDMMVILEAAATLHAQQQEWQELIVRELGTKKLPEPTLSLPLEVPDIFEAEVRAPLAAAIFAGKAGKDHIYAEFETLKERVAAHGVTVHEGILHDFFNEMVDRELHRGALEEGKRADGRPFDAVRELYVQAGGVSPVLHGTGIFYRGGTRILTALTLGGPGDAQLLDTIEQQETKKRFMHHYNFPPFSVGETGRVGGFNRRTIGHGALAEKALVPVIPEQEQFPYTIRLVSETLSSNGSSSMGSVCAATVALMDGGVPIKKPVAGIASGVLMAGNRYQLLTDIQGPEDEFGDMDFKVAGTRDGITAIQMDVKVDGIPLPILREALAHAKRARLHILDTITNHIAAPRPQLSPRAPEIVTLTIDPKQIGLVIGSGGKTINAIREATGVEDITIEDDGRVFIAGRQGTAEQAATHIRALTKTYEVGERLTATITRLASFGAFAALDAHHEGLIHISEIAPFRLAKMDGALEPGDTVDVVVTKIDDGKIGLSIKQVDPEFASRRGLTPSSENN